MIPRGRASRGLVPPKKLEAVTFEYRSFLIPKQRNCLSEAFQI
jgi:hypothetical protein